jgi:hypothetical protein
MTAVRASARPISVIQDWNRDGDGSIGHDARAGYIAFALRSGERGPQLVREKGMSRVSVPGSSGLVGERNKAGGVLSMGRRANFWLMFTAVLPCDTLSRYSTSA